MSNQNTAVAILASAIYSKLALTRKNTGDSYPIQLTANTPIDIDAEVDKIAELYKKLIEKLPSC